MTDYSEPVTEHDCPEIALAKFVAEAGSECPWCEEEVA